MAARGKKKPVTPRLLSDWENKSWPSAPTNVEKYHYCQSGGESFGSIAATLAGQAVPGASVPGLNYSSTMTWRDITLLNYGTTTTSEINWYLEHFNGAKRVTRDGSNYILSASDAKPWLWIPTDTPPAPIKNKRRTFSNIVLPPPPDEFSKTVRARFSDLDQDGDGFISVEEINKALNDHKYQGHEGAMVAVLKKKVSDLEELSNDEIGDENDGVTLADITSYDRFRVNNPNDSVIEKTQNTYYYAKNKIVSVNHNLFVRNGVLNPYLNQQGLLGDCWLLSAIVSVASRSQVEIKNMITPISGTNPEEFKVQFPGASTTVIVQRPTDAELAILSTSWRNGIWITVLEKAYAKLINDGKIWPYDAVIDAGLKGGPIWTGISLLTGNSTDTDTLMVTSNSTTRQKLSNAFQNDKIVLAGVRNALWGDSRANGLPMGHAYSILSFDAGRDKVVVRNPWGGNDQWGKNGINIDPAVIDGAFEMALSDFTDNFTLISYEQ